MKRYAPMLLLVLPFVVVQLRDPNSPRTIDVTLSRYAFSPERIEVELGVVSLDVAHGFQVKDLGLNVRVPASGKAVTVELNPKAAGTFEITCSEYCGSGHGRMKASLVVTPAGVNAD